MTPTRTTDDRTLTAEEFLAEYGHLSGVELVRGKVVWEGKAAAPQEQPMPKFRHGVVSYRAVRLLSDFIEANRLGWVAINDTFVRTENTVPATVRGADALFVSFNRLPEGDPPEDLTVPPDLVVEVRSPSDKWSKSFAKVGEYLTAGVTVVLVLDPHTESASVFRQDELQQIFHNGDEFTLPDVLPGFAVPVRRFFER
jgi:Uma2 family endonuclease